MVETVEPVSSNAGNIFPPTLTIASLGSPRRPVPIPVSRLPLVDLSGAAVVLRRQSLLLICQRQIAQSSAPR